MGKRRAGTVKSLDFDDGRGIIEPDPDLRFPAGTNLPFAIGNVSLAVKEGQRVSFETQDGTNGEGANALAATNVEVLQISIASMRRELEEMIKRNKDDIAKIKIGLESTAISGAGEAMKANKDATAAIAGTLYADDGVERIGISEAEHIELVRLGATMVC